MKEIDQTKIFLQTEGNKWFERNFENLTRAKNTPDVEFIVDQLKPFETEINSIIEVGCANGLKLKQISESLNARGCGIDPSEKAIAQGVTSRKVELNYQVGVASDIPELDNTFDLVYLSFCLYLVPPQEILNAYKEADRVLRPGGFLVIHDFDPGVEMQTPYHHVPGLISYKRNNSTYFTSLQKYCLVSKFSYSHSQTHFEKARSERVAVEILYKEVLN